MTSRATRRTAAFQVSQIELCRECLRRLHRDAGKAIAEPVHRAVRVEHGLGEPAAIGPLRVT